MYAEEYKKVRGPSREEGIQLGAVLCGADTRGGWYLRKAIAMLVVQSNMILLCGCRGPDELKETHMKFTQIALALQAYMDNDAESQYKQRCTGQSHVIRLEEVPWDEGRLPFLVRRAPEDMSGDSWFLQNGTKEPLWSWRVEITPYLECAGESLDYSQPWQAPANRKVLARYSYFFSYSGARQLRENPDRFPDAIALAITGPGTAFGCPGEEPKRRKECPADVIIVVEVRASGIPWPAPGDLDIRTMPRTINPPDGRGISSKHEGGFHVIFADGQVWFLSEKVPFQVVRKFFTVEEAAKHDREELLGPYVLWRSEARVP